jgi:hypothetical protein
MPLAVGIDSLDGKLADEHVSLYIAAEALTASRVKRHSRPLPAALPQ